MRVYIKGNYQDAEGRGHHGETLDIPDWLARKHIASGDAVEESEWLAKQELEAQTRKAAEEFEAERRERMGLPPLPPPAPVEAPAPSKWAGGVNVKSTLPPTVGGPTAAAPTAAAPTAAAPTAQEAPNNG